MRNIIVTFSLLAIIVFAVIGSLYIFEVRSSEEALELLLKMEGALLLLGVCSVAVAMLVSGSKEKIQD